MKNVGISKRIVNILRYFLTDRTMKVKIGNSYSETQNIPSGVPQGTSLFLIFIKNIKSEIELFAHDIKLLLRPLSKEMTQKDINKLLY